MRFIKNKNSNGVESMFKFLGMMDNYEERKIDKYECDEFAVSTVWVNDNNPPWETAIKHNMFNGGSWCVLEHYKTKEEAQLGHDKWVEKFKNDEVDEIVEDTPDSFNFEGFGREVFTKQ